MPGKIRITRKDFPHLRGVFREHGTFFAVSASPSEKGVKVTCVIPKKVAPKASARNLIKRRTRAIITDMLSQLPSLLLFFQAKRGAAEATYEELREDISTIVKKVRARHGA